ncbi:MAG: hypothetical protein IT449_16850 [Phycisphaerales bacterium]|nr:hypothetical protein [Phycisphaerales bacterium]
MQTLQDRLAQIVRTRLKGEADLETLPNEHVCGHVISPLFMDLDYQDRRRIIRKALDEAIEEGILVPSDQPLISTLLTYTPAEWSVVLTDIKD